MGDLKKIAGKSNREKIIKDEFDSLRIPTYTNNKSLFKTLGRKGIYEFERGVDYWVCKGPVPLVVADKLYNDSLGFAHILVQGNHARPSPYALRTDNSKHKGKVVASKGDYLWAVQDPNLGWVIPCYSILSFSAMYLFLDTLADAQLF